MHQGRPQTLSTGRSSRNPIKPAHQITRGLGWFSLRLGVTEVLGRRPMDETFGTRNRRNLFRAFGLREIGAGLGILLSRRPTALWLWARAAGDVLALSALGKSMRLPRARRDNHPAREKLAVVLRSLLRQRGRQPGQVIATR